jgi:hypothetical protein
MTYAATRQTAATLVRRVEVRTGSKMLAYEFIAEQIDRSATWVRQLISQGVGQVDAEVGRAIDALLIRELSNDMVRLNAEMDFARQSGAALNSDEVAEIQNLLARARNLLDGKK